MLTVRSFLFTAGILALSGPFASAQFTAVKIVETGVSYSGIGTFQSLPSAPSIYGTTIAFPGLTASGQGIYTVAGGTITAVATFATPVPSGIGNFTAFAPTPVGLSASGVAFGGNGNPAPGNLGVYTNVTGDLSAVATTATAFPAGGTFTGFSVPSLSGTTVTFAGSNSGPGTSLGVFSKTGAGALVAVASTSTAVPFGSGNFTSFADPSAGGTLPNVSGANVVFNGQGGGRFGVYTSISGAIGRVADNTTAVPSGSGTFTSFGITPAIDGTDVAFFGASPGRSGIYLASGGSLGRVADTTTAVPGGTGNFINFLNRGVALSGGRVVFAGTDSASRAGVYTFQAGSLQKIVAVGDVLDGHTVTSLSIGDFAYSGADTAVIVGYAGGAAVYQFVPVPEPTGPIFLLSTGLILARHRLRSRRASG